MLVTKVHVLEKLITIIFIDLTFIILSRKLKYSRYPRCTLGLHLERLLPAMKEPTEQMTKTRIFATASKNDIE